MTRNISKSLQAPSHEVMVTDNHLGTPDSIQHEITHQDLTYKNQTIRSNTSSADRAADTGIDHLHLDIQERFRQNRL